ncbi:Api2p SKDI_04G7230 [Saccharomyces kudriavzevii IFO 1802]|uniref:Uncharacterized protein n=1 Tax=Saccharomyces kudriavzevii (strain ATCC MYA-4449 / AS 2.2408 / CBS 8840 / NBRC 1802 / NCYC 2889) TaxID=226230 RepID=A0AA35NS53_SACK1|nr:uncharacterized protein SKDI_04G7230 [Saccharomyces kudriavzevii IFO 1802]CAI4059572.1 hypothetical protein SKDI_04G7230 [Saccharomyces kudriavzevii IFO 1802]
MTHSAKSDVAHEKKKSDGFLLLSFSYFSNGYSAWKRKGVARGIAILEIDFGVPRPEATKAANQAHRRGSMASGRAHLLGTEKGPEPGPGPYHARSGKRVASLGRNNRKVSRSRSA